ncbi:hypothetical protein B0H13DRAFT_1045091 [Mycena leptocephala]|nr:hypothetical protein B0H13DRAFT_1045091 [Mycena leptocephala]
MSYRVIASMDEKWRAQSLDPILPSPWRSIHSNATLICHDTTSSASAPANAILCRPPFLYRCARLLSRACCSRSRTHGPFRLSAPQLHRDRCLLGGLSSSLQVLGLSSRARRDESMDETTSVHGGGTKVLSRRSARGGDAFLHFLSPDPVPACGCCR